MEDTNQNVDDDEKIVHLDDNENDITSSIIVHDPTAESNVMKPKYEEKYESFEELKLCLVNYVVANGYPLIFEKLESTSLPG